MGAGVAGQGKKLWTRLFPHKPLARRCDLRLRLAGMDESRARTTPIRAWKERGRRTFRVLLSTRRRRENPPIRTHLGGLRLAADAHCACIDRALTIPPCNAVSLTSCQNPIAGYHQNPPNRNGRRGIAQGDGN